METTVQWTGKMLGNYPFVIENCHLNCNNMFEKKNIFISKSLPKLFSFSLPCIYLFPTPLVNGVHQKPS